MEKHLFSRVTMGYIGHKCREYGDGVGNGELRLGSGRWFVPGGGLAGDTVEKGTITGGLQAF